MPWKQVEIEKKLGKSRDYGSLGTKFIPQISDYKVVAWQRMDSGKIL